MNDASQLATAMVATVFAAVLLVTGQLFIAHSPHKELLPLRSAATVLPP